MDPEHSALPHDSVVRALTDDSAFRIIAARTVQTVDEIVRVQAPPPELLTSLADLVSGAILVRETMAPTLRVQAVLKGGAGSGQLVADSFPDGTTRGLAMQNAARTLSASQNSSAVLQVMRSMPHGGLHQGIVELPYRSSISEAMMSYMQQSEQVLSMVDLRSISQDEGIENAGGFIVQLLPEAQPEALDAMIARLSGDSPLVAWLQKPQGTALDLLAMVLDGIPYTLLEESPLRFGCQCSALRLITSMSTLPREEIESFVSAGEPLEIRCDYCMQLYRLDTEQLRGLLTSN